MIDFIVSLRSEFRLVMSVGDDMCHILRQHLGFSKDIVVKVMVFA
jgi:hypothetical protein